MAAAVALAGSCCALLLGFPVASSVTFLAPLTLLPLLAAYRMGSRRLTFIATLLFAFAEFIVGLHWVYAGAVTQRGIGDYLTAFAGLLLACIPYALLGVAIPFIVPKRGALWCIAVSALWTLCEYWRSTWALGIPYLQLGQALIDTPLVWLATFGGAALLTFLCALASCVIFELWTSRPQQRVALAGAVGVIALGLALLRPPMPAPAKSNIHAAVFQLGAISDDSSLDTYLRAYRRRVANSTFAVWPESGFPFAADAKIFSAVGRVHVPLLFGASVERGPAFYDVLAFTNANGKIDGLYAKRHLVPGNEYFPLSGIARLLRLPGADAPTLSPGHHAAAFSIAGTAIRVGPLICFESAFPALARSDVLDGANVLVAATNAAWFPEASSRFQQSQAARLVAIETGMPIVMAGTVGPSGLIDPSGAWHDETRPAASIAEIVAVPQGEETLYDRWGAAPLLALLAAMALFALSPRLRGNSSR